MRLAFRPVHFEEDLQQWLPRGGRRKAARRRRTLVLRGAPLFLWGAGRRDGELRGRRLRLLSQDGELRVAKVEHSRRRELARRGRESTPPAVTTDSLPLMLP